MRQLTENVIASMEAVSPQELTASDKGACHQPAVNLHDKINHQAAKIAQLQAQLKSTSQAFSEAMAKVDANQRAKTRVEQLDSRLIEQCVRAKTEAESKLALSAKGHAQHMAQLKSQYEKKLQALSQQVSQLKAQSQNKLQNLEQQLNQARTEAQNKTDVYLKKITSLETQLSAERQAHETSTTQLKAVFSAKLAQFKTEASGQIKSQAQTIAQMKARLEGTDSHTRATETAKTRAEQLNARLQEQCRMAKLGADAEVELKTKDMAEQMARIKAEAAKQLNASARQNSLLHDKARTAVVQIKKKAELTQSQYAQALERAKLRINKLEQTVAASTEFSPQNCSQNRQLEK